MLTEICVIFGGLADISFAYQKGPKTKKKLGRAPSRKMVLRGGGGGAYCPETMNPKAETGTNEGQNLKKA